MTPRNCVRYFVFMAASTSVDSRMNSPLEKAARRINNNTKFMPKIIRVDLLAVIFWGLKLLSERWKIRLHIRYAARLARIMAHVQG
jgi:hypothetical protein